MAEQNVGKVVEVKGVVIDVVFTGELPQINNALAIKIPGADGHGGVDLTGEVQQHLGGNRVRCVALGSTDGLVAGDRRGRHRRAGERAGRQGDARPRLQPARRARSTAGRPGDARALADPPRPARVRRASRPRPRSSRPGIKVVDLLTPFVRGGKIGLFGGAGLGKTVILTELIARIAKVHSGYVGLRRRRRADPRGERPLARNAGDQDRRTGKSVIDSTVMCFGQMNEPPGARLRVGPLGPDHGRVVPRLDGADTCSSSTTSSGSARPAPRSRPCWAGCRRTSATSRRWPPRWAPSRSGSPRPTRAPITSVQAVYVPADDLTDPAPATTFGFLDAFIVLQRVDPEKGIYPAVDPLGSTSRILDAQYVGQEHYDVAAASRRSSSATRSSATSSPSSASTSSPKTTRSSSTAPAGSSGSSRSRSSWPRSFTDKARPVHHARRHDPELPGDLRRQVGPPRARGLLYMVGTIDEAEEQSPPGPPRPSRQPPDARRLEVSLVTPDGSAYEGEAEMLIVPGAAGEIGVLARHAPLVALLKAGSTRVHVKRGTEVPRVRDRPRVLQGRAGPRARAGGRRGGRGRDRHRARPGPARGGAGRARRRSRQASPTPTAGSSSSASSTPRTSSRLRPAATSATSAHDLCALGTTPQGSVPGANAPESLGCRHPESFERQLGDRVTKRLKSPRDPSSTATLSAETRMANRTEQLKQLLDEADRRCSTAPGAS